MTEHDSDGRAGGSGGDPLQGLEEDRRRIDRIVERLDVADEPPERADLATELVRAVSRHEHIVEHAVVPAVAASLGRKAEDRLGRDRAELRDAMEYIHKRTRHLAARNAHAGDPQGLEDAIADVQGKVRAVLADEDAVLVPPVAALDAEARQSLEAAVGKAARHAAERPRPARTAVGRLVSNLATKVDHVVEDAATPEHPGAGTIEG